MPCFLPEICLLIEQVHNDNFFSIQLLFDLWDVLGMVGGSCLCKTQPDDQGSTKWLKGLVRESQMKTLSPHKRSLGNKIALTDISEEQFTSRDLLVMFSQGRFCVTGAFCLSGNTFKKETMPDRVHRASSPRTGLHSHGQCRKTFSLCSSKKKRKEKKEGKIPSMTHLRASETQSAFAAIWITPLTALEFSHKIQALHRQDAVLQQVKEKTCRTGVRGLHLW